MKKTLLRIFVALCTVLALGSFALADYPAGSLPVASLVPSGTNGQVATTTAGAVVWQTPTVAAAPTGTGVALVSSGAFVSAAGQVDLSSSTYVKNTTGLANGGTGLSTASGLSTGNGLYVNSGTTIAYSPLSLNGGANWVTGALPIGNEASPTGTGVALVSSGVWSAAAGTVNLASTTYVTGTLPLGNGGTGLSTASGLTVGNADYVATGTTRAYSALNLAGGAGWVTNSLPLSNEASPTGTGVALVSSGAWSAAAGTVNLASTTYVAGTLPLGNGGTGLSTASGLTVGNTLGVATGTTIAYSALNLAGGAGYVSGTLPLGNGGTGLSTASGLTTGAVLAASSGTTIAYTNIKNLPSEPVAQDIFADGTNVEFFNTSTTDCGTSASGVICIAPQTTAPSAFPTNGIGLRQTAQLFIVDAKGIYIGPNSSAAIAEYTVNAQPSTSAGSGAAGSQTNFAAQAGQPATGASNNGGNGGASVLMAPIGGTSGSATAGNPGTTGFGACSNALCSGAGTSYVTLGGTGVGIQLGANTIATATGTVTPTAAQASLPLQILTASLSGNLTINWPNATNAFWYVDISGLTFSAHNLVLGCGTGATPVTLTALTTNDNILFCKCTGANVMVCNL